MICPVGNVKYEINEKQLNIVNCYNCTMLTDMYMLCYDMLRVQTL